ncbi:MAG TPA: metallophosphoesterase [Sphingomicrobium sp.]|nr:metallophosphoesterase [Sphingomicrobium sp.]
MARLLHLSDLHFGAHDDRLVAAVEDRVNDEKPDLVVVSGDFTQRARTNQFEQACAFLERLRDAGHEVLGVPGNHDIPLYDVLRRFLSPLTRYRKYIDDTLCPFHQLPTAAVLGINTARSATFKQGKINDEQVAFIRDTFSKVEASIPRILVTHHPIFALPTGDGIGDPVKNQAGVLDMIGEIGVDLLLAGHNHRASHQDSADFVTKSTGALVIQAGTATSTRVRGEHQSFNRIIVNGENVEVTLIGWHETEFRDGDPARFTRQDGRWVKLGEEGIEKVPVAPKEAAASAN